MNEAYQLNHPMVEHQLKLALVWQAKKRFQQAIASYEKIIQQQPDYIPAYLGLGGLFVEMGQEKEAIEIYRRAVKLNPRETWLPFLLDNLLIKQGDFTDQETQLEQLVDQYQRAVSKKVATKQPHILLYTNCSSTYGAEQASHALMCHLATLGYRVTCVQSKANHHLIDARVELGIKHVWLKDNARSFTYSVSNVSEVIEVLSQILPDLIIFADGDPTSNLAANRVAMRLQIPYVRIIHCVMPDWAEQFAAFLYLLPDIYKAAEAVISVSQANLHLMREKFELPQHLGQVIYNGRPDEFFAARNLEVRQRLRQSLRIPQEATVIFTAARMDAPKGYQHLLKAIEQLQKTSIWSQLYFVWAGTGSIEAELKSSVDKIGVSEQVKFLGERSDIPDLLDASDLFVLSSHVEGMPLAVMEAMAKGIPVMATAVSGVPEELGDTGKLLPDPTIDSIATIQAIVDTVQAWTVDSELREAVAQACRQRAAAMFREEQMLAAYVKLIQQAICTSSHR